MSLEFDMGITNTSKYEFFLSPSFSGVFFLENVV